MQKSETFISYEGVKQAFEGDIAFSGSRFLVGVNVSLKALRMYLNGVRSKIETLPRVNIVLCKDCQKFNRCNIAEEGDFGPLDSCSSGKRRQDEEATK